MIEVAGCKTRMHPKWQGIKLHKWMNPWFFTSIIINLAILWKGPKTDIWQLYMLSHKDKGRETKTSVSAGHIS